MFDYFIPTEANSVFRVIFDVNAENLYKLPGRVYVFKSLGFGYFILFWCSSHVLYFTLHRRRNRKKNWQELFPFTPFS